MGYGEGADLGLAFLLCATNPFCGSAWAVISTAIVVSNYCAQSHPGDQAYCASLPGVLKSFVPAMTDEFLTSLSKLWNGLTKWFELIDPSGQASTPTSRPGPRGDDATAGGGTQTARLASYRPGYRPRRSRDPPTRNADILDGTFDGDAAPRLVRGVCQRIWLRRPGQLVLSAVTTAPFQLPPPAVGLNLTLDCPGLGPPRRAYRHRLDARHRSRPPPAVQSTSKAAIFPRLDRRFRYHPDATSLPLVSSSALQAIVPEPHRDRRVTAATAGGTSTDIRRGPAQSPVGPGRQRTI